MAMKAHFGDMLTEYVSAQWENVTLQRGEILSEALQYHLRFERHVNVAACYISQAS